MKNMNKINRLKEFFLRLKEFFFKLIELRTEKAAWIAGHGSDHLRRGFARGHDCQRLYCLERGALEAPGFIVDYDGKGKWQPIGCPSVKALDAAAAADSLNLGDVEIVRLVLEPIIEYGKSYSAVPLKNGAEAILVKGYLKTTLVKAL
jgi:hypothetical protein